jgi:hypothetical protein
MKAAATIESLQKCIGVNRIQLAALLGVSDRAIADWVPRALEELTTTKGLRLRRLAEVAAHLQAKLGGSYTPELCRKVIEDGRVPLEGVGDDDTVSLISYICACPDEKGWPANADAALADYLHYLKRRKEPRGTQVQDPA